MRYLRTVIIPLSVFVCSIAVAPVYAATTADCQPGNGVFTACFYSGTSFNSFLIQRQDPQINFVWGLGTVYPGGPIFQFSARWQGNFSFNSGSYRFTTTADQGARLYIDGRLVLDRWSGGQGNSSDVVQILTAGTHLITLEYFNGWDYAYAKLSWQPDSGYRTFYVSPSGSDQNDGRTPTTAWKTAAKVTLATFQAGDHIMFEGGQSFSGPIYFGADDLGTAFQPIIVTSYGTGRATIQGGRSVGLLAYNVAGIEVRNLKFEGSAGNDKDGVQFYQTLPGDVKLPHILIDSVETSGFGSAGISIFSWSGISGYSDVRITNVSAHDNLRAGIWIGGYLTPSLAGYAHYNLYIGNCQVYNNPGVTDLLNDTGFGIFIDSTNGAVIEGNVIYNNGLNSFSLVGGPIGIMAMEANNVIVQNNEVHDIHASLGDGGGINFDGGVTNSVIQYNYTHNNDGAGINLAQYSPVRVMSSNNTIRYNISQNDGRRSLSWAGIMVAGPVQGSHIYNNTVYGTANPSRTYTALGIAGATTNLDIRNNVFFTMDGMQQVAIAGGQVGMTLRGNAYWGGGLPLNMSWGFTNSQTLTNFRIASGQEILNGVPTGMDINPLLTAPGTGPTLNQVSLLGGLAAYTPLPGSPLIDRGMNMAAAGVNPGVRDFMGTLIPLQLAFDVGAVEAH